MKTSESGVVKCFQFGPFRLDTFNRTLLADGKRLTLPSKAFDTLVVLIENRGTVVDKKTLMDLVWPDTAVEENNLAQAIGAVRKALGEQPGDQRYVLTVPGRGYSFVAAVSEVNENRAAPTPPNRPRAAVRIAGLSAAAVLIAAAAAWLWSGRPSHQPRLVPLTGSNNEGTIVTFSPDGDRVAYVWRPEDGRPSGIYVKVVGAGDPLPIATGRNEKEPAWSPDGRYIAYSRDPHGLYLVPALGGAERKITDLRDHESQGRRMSWSPDGKRLAIADLDPDTGFSSIFELFIDTGERRRLTSGLSVRGDSNPAFSPDGKSLAFVRKPVSGASALYVIPAAGGDPRRVTSFEEAAFSFDWTADGREIVYDRGRGGVTALWRVPFPGGTPKRIADAGFDAAFPVIARSGSRMAFSLFRYTINLWRLDFDQPSRPRKLAPTNRRQSSPQYSPDGSKLAFVSNRSGWDEIWTSDNVGGNLMALSSMGELGIVLGTPRWSPDGLEIAFAAGSGANVDLYVVSAQGGAPRRITSDPAEDILPSFSRDGRYIYFSSNRTGEFQIWRAARTGGDPVQVTTQGGVAGLVSADGKYVYYMNYRRSNELWRVPTAEGAEEMVFEGSSVWKGAPWRTYWGWWTVGAEGIVYVDRDSAGPQTVYQIKRFDPKTRAISTLAQIPQRPTINIPCIAISPDGRSAVFTQMEDPAQGIMLLEDFR